MHLMLMSLCLFCNVPEPVKGRADCGCKALRPCYEEMIDDLQYGDEVSCISGASIGTSTLEVYLKALSNYCPETITVKEAKVTFEGRTLFEVILEPSEKPVRQDADKAKSEKPVILLEAGQLAGRESVGLALFYIEQLVGCQENAEMLTSVKFVVLPCSNPDGLEYNANLKPNWKKNLQPIADKPGLGVDISRNFDYKFSECSGNKDPLSPHYPGDQPNSEVESQFITDVINYYGACIKAYVSIRRNGHALLYPHAGSESEIPDDALVKRAVDMITTKINHRIVTIQQFENMSIYEMNGEKQCGSSVDYAYDNKVKIALELRVFLGEENLITSIFQSFPRNYESSLRTVYLMTLRELYNIVANKLLE